MASPLTASPKTRSTIEQVVDQWLGKRDTARHDSPKAAASIPAPPPVAPPLSSFQQLEPSKPKPEKKETKPVGFVCEDDVRSAILSNAKITVGKKTIITPSARDLGEASDVFVLAD
jgi:hypothetical protein